MGLIGPRVAVWGLLLLALGLVVLGCSRPEEKPLVRIGILNLIKGAENNVAAFKEGMAAKGYVEGKDIVYLYPGLLGAPSEAEEVARKMVEDRLDMILAMSTQAALAAKKATSGTAIPVVFGPCHDPVESGVVESLARPGGNLTGVRVRGSNAKMLDWLLQADPRVKAIYVPYHKENITARQSFADLKIAADALGIELLVAEVGSPEDLRNALANIPESANALWATHSFLIMSHLDDFVQTAIARRIPVVSPGNRQENGVLLTYGANFTKIGTAVSVLADRILKGATPAEIPVETVEYSLGLNLKTAEAIGLHMSDALLNQADDIVR